MDQNINPNVGVGEYIRLSNNFYQSQNIGTDYNRIVTDVNLANYIMANRETLKKRHKVAFTFICLNPLYWEFAKKMVDGARQFFLPGHDTDFLFWTDIPESKEAITAGYRQGLISMGLQAQETDLMAGTLGIQGTNKIIDTPNIINGAFNLRSEKDIKVFPIEPIEWPYPTLFRYNLFLQQEEILKEYDYIFYCDIDMMFANVVGDEILGDGLTSAQHPMYAHRKEYFPPYEPNPESEAYIPRPGKIIMENGKPRLHPLYFAGGFQGGKSDVWIKAMKEMRKMIDKDLLKNYIPIWNDESVWNKYLFLNPPSVVLTPSYIYPDSLIKEYYEPLWGRSYIPKLVTLTKWFTLTKEGGDHVQQFLNK